MDFPKSQNDPPLAAFQRPVHQSAHFKKQRLQTTSASETQAERCASSLRPLLWSASSLDPALRSVCRLLGEGAGGGGGGASAGRLGGHPHDPDGTARSWLHGDTLAKGSRTASSGGGPRAPCRCGAPAVDTLCWSRVPNGGPRCHASGTAHRPKARLLPCQQEQPVSSQESSVWNVSSKSFIWL